jgi:RHS repeat-associated protein
VAGAPATAGVGVEFAYAGRPVETRTGLSDNRARWYEPATGRFVNEDPSGFKGGDANLFRYVGNDPLNQVDPSGLAAKWASGAKASVPTAGWAALGQQAQRTPTTVTPSVSAMAYAGLGSQPAAMATNASGSATGRQWQEPTSSQPRPNNVELGPISGWLAGKAEASRSSGGILGAIGHMAYGTAVGPAALLDTVYPRAVPQAAFNAYAQAEKVAATSSSPVDRAIATVAMAAGVYGGARSTLPGRNPIPQTWPVGVEYDGVAYRAVPTSRISTAWEVHAGNVAASHRYSAPGEGALYAGTSREAVMAELTYYGVDPRAVSWSSRTVAAKNILDLTDPASRARVGVTLKQLTEDDYSVTQALGRAARSRYDGILAPSARSPGSSNLILFPKKSP